MHSLSSGDPSTLSVLGNTDVIHMIKLTRASPSNFEMCKFLNQELDGDKTWGRGQVFQVNPNMVLIESSEMTGFRL